LYRITFILVPLSLFFVLYIAVLPIKGAVEKEREGAGHIKNQMEARAAYCLHRSPSGAGPWTVWRC
jgi:hypothetical protein